MAVLFSIFFKVTYVSVTKYKVSVFCEDGNVNHGLQLWRQKNITNYALKTPLKANAFYESVNVLP